MMPDLITENMTKAYGEEADFQHKHTFAGMAHFAATGPVGETCRRCIFWNSSGAYRRESWGGLRPRVCRKSASLKAMARSAMPAVPHDAMACKYFEEGIRIPVADQPGKFEDLTKRPARITPAPKAKQEAMDL